ncbi:DUF4160 domain-containing protein [Sphingomonas naphthae]|uniref:DUF4160 domain-containing protein n=1 Tax=Sphingomonas naphthae TaxID=1813468 RepID=A0ABY7TL71_9SPHN|nr:DUF4160 domain-containing protein [Sphingomonas naphthae]WCT73526.1 DUF4160 domain-containing protein [Sphingomonas naphthae]
MPLVFRDKGLRFHFFSNEGNPREPIHIHVERDGHEAKFWLGDTIELAYNHGLDRRSLAMALLIIRARKRELQDAWHGHFR